MKKISVLSIIAGFVAASGSTLLIFAFGNGYARPDWLFYLSFISLFVSVLGLGFTGIRKDGKLTSFIFGLIFLSIAFIYFVVTRSSIVEDFSSVSFPVFFSGFLLLIFSSILYFFNIFNNK